jgi:hypothetical protein
VLTGTVCGDSFEPTPPLKFTSSFYSFGIVNAYHPPERMDADKAGVRFSVTFNALIHIANCAALLYKIVR